MTDRYWLTYTTSTKTPNGLSTVPNRTGFIDSSEKAREVGNQLAEFDHVSNVVIEKISFVDQIKP